jgi:uncharacterized membrane protein (UPF0182 family)
MYVALLLGLLAVGGWLSVGGSSVRRVWAGRGLIAATVVFFAALNFWGEALWFESVGYASRFWTVVAAKAVISSGGALIGAATVFLLMRPATFRSWPVGVGAAIGGVWGFARWELVLLYLNAVPMNVSEPIFGKDAGFYLFDLPFFLGLRALLLTLPLIAAAAALVPLVRPYLRRSRADTDEWTSLHNRLNGRGDQAQEMSQPVDAVRPNASLYVPAGFLLLVLGWAFYLARHELMYSQFGAVNGPGWTDVHVMVPAYWTLSGLCVAFGILVLAPAARIKVHEYFHRPWKRAANANSLATATPFAAVAILAAAFLWTAPALSQWLKVQPNEITLERQYLANEIAFTRLGFRLHEVENRQFPAVDILSPATVAQNQELLSQVRLWDDRVLRDVYRQFQAIRLYYQFHHVDVDRYRIDGRLTLVMVSAREMLHANLPTVNQTFVNTRFKYTHGYGITLTPVSEFTQEGLPNLLVHGIPPISDHPELQVERPEIYYGMLTTSPAFANSREAEFDYPSGAENVYAHYAGTGGIELRNFWRKVVFGWKLDGTQFLFSSYPTPDTRVKFRRQVLDRVQALAPFLSFNREPYIVLSGGKLYWLVEGYTTSTHFPYSKRYDPSERIDYSANDTILSLHNQAGADFAGANYIRNAVKAVVDAYTGSVDFYVFEPDDPIIEVWTRILPDLFKPASEMPAGLRAHVRYPQEFLLVQGLVNARYHMEDPDVFYNQEDLWMRATERYYEQVQPVEPYHIMWTPPESTEPEFVAMLPFTPKGRQVLIGWMAGLSDGSNYGRLITYKFPKDKRILGPQQVDTKIDQHPALKAQLTLWDQRGSRVIRGNVLAIPVDNTLLYVEPIFIEAGTAAYPELRVVALMHGDKLSYADTFAGALAGLIDRSDEDRAVATAGVLPSSAARLDLARAANDAFDRYLLLQGEMRFVEAAEQLDRLRRSLQQLHAASPD